MGIIQTTDDEATMIPGDIQERIGQAKRVCVFTGAGVSAESGIPTFRDAGGLWENYRPEDLVTIEAYERDPVLVWRWHIWLQNLCFNSQPNAAHDAIAKLDHDSPDFLCITQNIDDLHERAGTNRIVKIHGDIMETRCLSKGHISHLDTALDGDAIKSMQDFPKCPKCGSICRPNVVWFGEMLPIEPLDRARRFASRCDLFIIVGTSGVVSGGYGFTDMAKANGAFILEINPQASELTYLADLSIRLPATQALPEIFAAG